MRSLFTKLLGDFNEKALKKISPILVDVNAEESRVTSLSDDALRNFGLELRRRCEAGESLDELLPESFAATREAARRTLGQRHYDVQVLGGIVLHQGKIAEMRTGEGKTQTAALPVALNALTGRGVHVITVNDYLAKRDVQWMGQIYHALGLTVGCIQHDAAFQYNPDYESDDERMRFLEPIERRAAYQCDITYGTNNEFGFDYLRDNMVAVAAQMVQRDLVFAIVDEVDNILIDEARTPLIISGPADRSTDRYSQFSQIVKQLRNNRDYEIDLKTRTVNLNDAGIDRVEQLLGLPAGEGIFDERHIDLTHYLEQALRAEAVYHRDKDYIVRDGEVIIVDEFTGRMMVGRRYSEGLHQAIEAKEGVRVQRQNVTLATITFQNYFRMYEKLAGMTGTAKTEEEEFQRIYDLEVVTIPTNKPTVRDDGADLVFRNERSKFDAVVREIESMHEQGRPVLVGTTSVEKSEYLSDLLKRRGVDHEVLNAKQHEREASIVERAGQPGAVTIATNMAGRGTDIKLGPGVRDLGGLHIVGTERHESRRIDNQLRGRAGRQGDPGSTRFYVSIEDDLMKRFSSERVGGLMDRLGMDEDIPIEHRVITKSIEGAQTKVEGHNFDIRRHVVQYDDVMNRHRETIYADRRQIVKGDDMSERIAEMIAGEIESIVAGSTDERGEIDYERVFNEYGQIVQSPKIEVDDIIGLTSEELIDLLDTDADEVYGEVEQRFGEDVMRHVERHVMLSVIDKLWVQHLTEMDDLRDGVGLQAYGQRDPLVVYKTEGFRMFGLLLNHIRHDVVHTIFRVQPAVASEPTRTRITDQRTTHLNRESDGAPANQTVQNKRKIGANDPCWCGSGKKYKRCHGAPAGRTAAV
ncbi:MAG: preprotein translocase subunit SecA [Thermomicrobiales bacterium]|nr:preprotein translocase subunit SecA [Thermomicrobiales bacterium]